MRMRVLPSVEALSDTDDERLLVELRLQDMRERVAMARELLDAVEVQVLVPMAQKGRPATEPSSTPSRDQAERAAEELARLGCRIVELAGDLVSPAQPARKRKGRALHSVR